MVVEPPNTTVSWLSHPHRPARCGVEIAGEPIGSRAIRAGEICSWNSPIFIIFWVEKLNNHEKPPFFPSMFPSMDQAIDCQHFLLRLIPTHPAAIPSPCLAPRVLEHFEHNSMKNPTENWYMGQHYTVTICNYHVVGKLRFYLHNSFPGKGNTPPSQKGSLRRTENRIEQVSNLQ